MIETTMLRSTIKRLLDKSEDDCMLPSIVYCDRGGGGSSDRKRRKRKNSWNNKFINKNSQQLLLLASSLLCYCLIIPFSEASSSSMTNISNLQQPQPLSETELQSQSPTVQISNSYSSSSHVKPSHNNINYNYSNFSNNMNYTRNNNNQNQTYSPSIYSNYKNNNTSNNNSNKAMRRISFLPKFANLIFPSASSPSSYTPVSNYGSGSGSISNSPTKRRRRVRPTNNNTVNNKNNPNQNRNKNKNSNNHNNNNKRTKKRKKKPSKSSSGAPQKTRIAPNFDSLLMSNLTKPTMHPLRVLQTEITMMNKTQSQSQGFLNLRTVSSTTPSSRPSPLRNLMHNNNHYDMMGLNKSNDKYDSNLENHRLVDTIPSVFVTNPNQFNGNSPITSGKESNMIMTVNSVVVANKPRIPVYIPQNRSKSGVETELKDILQGNETTVRIPQTLENSNSSNTSDSGPSPTEDAFLSLVNTGQGKSEGRSALMSRFSGEESKQLHSPSYFNHINDQIAEEDNHYEVTERFPDNYERNPQHQNQNQQHQNQNQQHQNQNQQHHQHQLQTVAESQQQMIHHSNNPHSDNNNNDYRHTNTDPRPKLNSYYDNYYSANSNAQHYHTNDHRDEFYHHHNELPSHHGYPDHHHPSGHPKHPQSFKGEHDLQSADTIMDRFEVFYKEYKLLTWVGFLVVTGLALVCVLAYLYINNPPTEVVTARSKMTEYLRDPSLLKFLHNLLEGEDPFPEGKRRRRKKNLTSSHPSSKAKEL